MNAYYLKYEALGIKREGYVDAKNVESAKKKIEKQIHCEIKVLDVSVVGYY